MADANAASESPRLYVLEHLVWADVADDYRARMAEWQGVSIEFLRDEEVSAAEGAPVRRLFWRSSDLTVLAGTQITLDGFQDYNWGEYLIYPEGERGEAHMPVDVIPRGFWPQIEHQLRRLGTPSVDSFDTVRDILLDPRYDDVMDEIDRNGARTFDTDTAFFAGSGGNTQLKDALRSAGWDIRSRFAHHYVARSAAGDCLTYCEGDVLRGDRMSE